MRGALGWPLGNHMSPQVVALQGWSYVLVGGAAFVMTVLLVAFPALLASNRLPVRLIVGCAVVLAAGLIVAGMVPFVRSLRMSRSRTAS